jgi:Tfp pilus assembly protein PilN
MNTLAMMSGVVGIIGCVIGVATFSSAQLTKAKQDGMFLAKIDQCVKGIDEIKRDMKEKNTLNDKIIADHSQRLSSVEVRCENLEKNLN